MDYFDKINLLTEDDFFNLFSKLGVEPRIVTSAGKRSIQIIGACHHGDNHSALFDPSTLKVHCFSECGGAMLLHNFVKKTLRLPNAQFGKDFIEDWIENQSLDFSNRISRDVSFEYKEKHYTPEIVSIVNGIDKAIVTSLYSEFDTSIDTLKDLVWSSSEGIEPELLKLFDVGYNTNKGTIILPHHNLNGEIVGIYERSFKSLRREVQKKYPDTLYKDLLQFPRAKYVPLLKEEKYQTETSSSWSFPNSQNLYGLHLAKETIKETGIAIVFEGAKSVMLSRQYGQSNAVATHTFGIHLNHISMLIEAGAKEIVLAFDKQYTEESGRSWELYQKKTIDVHKKVKDHVLVTRVRDPYGLLQFKDSPTDAGKEVFLKLYKEREKFENEIKEEEFSLAFTVPQSILQQREQIRKGETGLLQMAPLNLL